jgi:membrane protein implicated in regulation of membrane protease activity
LNPLRFQLLFALFLATTGFLLLPGRAYAYIDPGSGSLIWQVLIAGLLSGLMLVKVYWYRIRKLITGREPAKVEDEDRDDQ